MIRTPALAAASNPDEWFVAALAAGIGTEEELREAAEWLFSPAARGAVFP